MARGEQAAARKMMMKGIGFRLGMKRSISYLKTKRTRYGGAEIEDTDIAKNGIVRRHRYRLKGLGWHTETVSYFTCFSQSVKLTFRRNGI